MTERKKAKRSRAVALQGNVSVKEYGGKVKTKQYHKVERVPVEPGPAAVSVTHGQKYWESYDSGGITVESTCSVQLTCQQSTDQISEANEIASSLAYSFMKENQKKFDEVLNEAKKS